MLLAGLAGATAILAGLAIWQRVEIQRLKSGNALPVARPAASLTIHTSAGRNIAVVPPASAAHLPEEVRQAAEFNDFVFSAPRAPERRPRVRSPLARLLDNPEFLQALGRHRQSVVDARFAGLFRQLNLTEEELATFKRLLAEKENVALDVVAINDTLPEGPLTADALRASVRTAKAQVEEAIRASLGSERYAVYREFEQTIAHRATVAQLQQRLSYTAAPLTPAQADSLVRVLATNAPADSASTAPAISIAVATSNAGALPLLAASAPVGRITDEAIAQSQAVLAPVQIAALRDLQVEQAAGVRAAQLLRDNLPGFDEFIGLGLPPILQ